MQKFTAMLGIMLVSTLILLSGKPGTTWIGILTGLIGGSALVLAEMIAKDWHQLTLLSRCLVHYRKPVRISAAYLFRIVLDDKYLLVRGRRFKNQFQPVGGVYKTNTRSAEAMRRLGVTDDHFISFDPDLAHDLRIRIKGARIPSFMRWFDSGHGRETSPWREFREELLETQYLDEELFKDIEYEFLERKLQFRYSDQAECWELLIANIYELLPTPGQQLDLQRASKQHNADYRWVTSDTISQRTTAAGRPESEAISGNSGWLL